MRLWCDRAVHDTSTDVPGLPLKAAAAGQSAARSPSIKLPSRSRVLSPALLAELCDAIAPSQRPAAAAGARHDPIEPPAEQGQPWLSLAQPKPFPILIASTSTLALGTQ